MKRQIIFLLNFLYTVFTYSQQETRLWYSAPAKEWTEALPVGNGRLGGMVYGTPLREEIQINEETVWGGGPHRNDNPAALPALSKVRQLVFEGKNMEAQNMIDQEFKTPRNEMPYQTIGSLFLDFGGHENYTEYYRELDLSRAVAMTRYKVGNITYTREILSSFSDNIIVMKISSSQRGELKFRASYNSPMSGFSVKKDGNRLLLIGVGSEHEGMKGQEGREVFSIKAPPCKAFRNNNDFPYEVNKSPYLTIAARQHGEAWNHPFVSIFEPTTEKEGKSIQSIESFDVAGVSPDFVGLIVKSKSGRTDYIFSSIKDEDVSYNNMAANGTYAVISEKGNDFTLFLGNGTLIQGKELTIISNEKVNAILEYKNGEYFFTSDKSVVITKIGNKQVNVNKTGYQKIKL